MDNSIFDFHLMDGSIDDDLQVYNPCRNPVNHNVQASSLNDDRNQSQQQLLNITSTDVIKQLMSDSNKKVIQKPDLSTSQKQMVNPIPCNSGSVMPQAKVSIPQNHPNHMPKNPGTVVPHPGVSILKNPTADSMLYNPETVMPQPGVSTSRYQTANNMPYNPRTIVPWPSIPQNHPNHMPKNPENVVPHPGVSIPKNPTADSMLYNPGSVMPQPGVSTSRYQTANNMPYNPRTIVSWPEMCTSSNQMVNPIPCSSGSVMPQAKVSISQNHTNLMQYNPETVIPPQLGVPASRYQTKNPISYNPGTVVPYPGVSSSRNQTANSMLYNPGTVMQQPGASTNNPRTIVPWPEMCTPKHQMENSMSYNYQGTVMPQPGVSTSRNQTMNRMPAYNPGTVVPQYVHPNSSTKDDEMKKPSASYLKLIADALLASENGMLVLGDICQSIMNKYAYYRSSNSPWKGGIRHSLSVNNCFYIAKASQIGKDSLWAIHHSCVKTLRNGNYNRRKVSQIVQKSYSQNGSTNTTADETSVPQMPKEDNPSSPPSATESDSTQQQNAPAAQH